MQPFRLNLLFYILGIVLAFIFYFLLLDSGGYRLPRYYSMDGQIFADANHPPPRGEWRIISVNGKPPTDATIIFKKNTPVLVKTNLGMVWMQPIPNHTWKLFNDFKYLIFFSFIFLICAFWFSESGKDFHLAFYCFVVAIFLFTLVSILSFHSFVLLGQVAFLFLVPALVNVGLRTTGKEISGLLLLGQLTFVLFLSLVAYVGGSNIDTLNNLELIVRYLFYGGLILVVLLQFEYAIRKTLDPIEKRKRWTLLGGTTFGLLLPLLLFDLKEIWWGDENPLSYLSVLFLLFPLSLLYGTYRIQLMPFQFVLTQSILAGILTVFFALIYGLVFLAYNLLLPEEGKGERWILHLTLVLIIVFFLDPARRKLAGLLQRRVFRLDKRLTESLESLANLISSPIHIQYAINGFTKEISEILGLEKLNLLFSQSTFPDLALKNDALLRLPDQHPAWRLLRTDKLLVTSYLTYGGGSRGELYRYLFRNRFYMAVGIGGSDDDWSKEERFSLKNIFGKQNSETEVTPEIRTALLIGYKKTRLIFKLAEIRYLQEAARLSSMLIYNFTLLLQEVEKRKKMRELFLAGQVQRSFQDKTEYNIQGIRISAFNLPVISVTGDYLDLFAISPQKIAFFLGDVSGHGLGTGYLVSTFRSMIRSHLQSGAGLPETIETLNQFLNERYKGSEFITLFAFVLNTASGDMEYINAAHPGPYICRTRTDEIIHLKDSQRLLGILQTPYTSSRLKFESGDRLFVYSDGVTETFDGNENPYGDRRLSKFIEKNKYSPLEEITDKLREDLRDFRGGDELTDDTTFVVFEYSPGLKPLQNLLHFLGLEQNT